MNDQTDLLECATSIAHSAGRVTLQHFRSPIVVDTKDDGSPVTIADRTTEELIRSLIREQFPDDGIMGEEGDDEASRSGRRWIIDPIDGTRSFVRGVPLYGVMIAVEEGTVITTGVLHFPALNETVCAANGRGCWWNGKRARVSACDTLSDALLVATDRESMVSAGRGAAFERVAARAGLVRTWGDCYGYALVATGRAEAMFDAMAHPWDLAALVPIISEAGGVLTDWDGAPTWQNGSAVATNGNLASTIRGLLNQPCV